MRARPFEVQRKRALPHDRGKTQEGYLEALGGVLGPFEEVLEAAATLARVNCGAPPDALLGRSEWKKVLRAFDRFLQTSQQVLEVFAALDEIDVRGVDNEEVGGGVAEEEVFIGGGDLPDVGGRDLRFVAGGLFGDAGPEHFGLGLEVNDEIGRGNSGGQGIVVAVVEFELFVIEIEIGEDAVFLEEEIGEDRAGSFDSERFADALLALDEEIHLGAERGAGFFLVEVGEERIVFAVIDAASVEAFGQDFGESGFADAEGALDDDVARRLRAALWASSPLRCGGFVGRHRFAEPLERLLEQPRRNRVNGGDYSRVVHNGIGERQRFACVVRGAGRKAGAGLLHSKSP